MTDLSGSEVAAALGTRPHRVYPALVSTEADAVSWARAGAAPGSVVVAAYQTSARRRGGVPWPVDVDRGIGFSVVLSAERPMGWWYPAASSAVADVVGGAQLAWPDEILVGRRLAATVSVAADPRPLPSWLVLTVLVADADPPRAPLLGDLVAAAEAQSRRPPADVVDDYRRRCRTLGRRVVARLVPLGPASTTVEGRAVDCRADGSLAVVTDDDRTAVIRPEDVGTLDVEW